MTIDEAIEELQINGTKEPLELSGSAIRMMKYFEALAIASETLEKQKAKDIHIYSNGEEHCPNCDANLTGMGFKYCVECGQKLKEGE